MSSEADKTAGTTGTAEEVAPGTTKAAAKPRTYVVFRDRTAGEIAALIESGDIDAKTVLMVPVGSHEATTPKAARIAVAKAKVPADELRTDDREKGGVILNAVVESALRSGKAPVRMFVEETLL